MAEGIITPEEYMTKLDHFIVSRTNGVLNLNNQTVLRQFFDAAAVFYQKQGEKKTGTKQKAAELKQRTSK